MTKLCLVTSPGGHLYQIHLLRKWWCKYSRFWVTLPSPDVKFLLKRETVYYAFGPENRHLGNLIKNLFFATNILLKEKPDIVFSTGAGLAPPFFWIAKALGIRTVYLEAYDFIDRPSMTAKLASPFTSTFLVQHSSLLKHIPHAKYWGSVL